MARMEGGNGEHGEATDGRGESPVLGTSAGTAGTEDKAATTPVNPPQRDPDGANIQRTGGRRAPQPERKPPQASNLMETPQKLGFFLAHILTYMLEYG